MNGLAWINAHWIEIAATLAAMLAVGTAAHRAALELKAAGWLRLAAACEVVSHVLLNAYSIAASLATAFGRPVRAADKAGFADVRVLGVMVVALAAWLACCGGTQLERDMRAADALGLAANRAEPLWLDAYRREGRAAADRTCSALVDPACVEARLAAVHGVEARWSRVRDQWEIARQAHDALAVCLEDARAHDGGLCPDAESKRAALSAAVMLVRCELRAVGHSEIDPLGSSGLVCFGDGGAR